MDENNLKKIQEAIDSLPDNFSVLEEKIDVELQMEYFDAVNQIRNEEEVPNNIIEDAPEILFNKKSSRDQKKELLIWLAGVDDVEAFRIIERFHKKTRGELRSWAVLALQESRMLLQSSLLNEQQVFISTGLGGRDQKLRYFAAVMKTDYDEEFTDTQKKLINGELAFYLKKLNGELEDITFDKGFALCLFLFPLKQNLHDVLSSFIKECNQYGGFLNEDIIITNVKALTSEEIISLIENHQKDLDEEQD